MPFQPVPSTAEFRIVQETTASNVPRVDMINTVYLRRGAGAWPSGELTSAMNQVRGAWDANIRPVQSNSIRTIAIQARDLSTEFGARGELAANLAGGIASTTSSTSLAYPVKLIGMAGAAPRAGRLFIPGVPESMAEVNTLDAASRTQVRNAVLGLLEGMGTIDWDPVIVSRTLAGAPRPQGVTNLIEDVVVNALLWSQRDRRPTPLSG